MLAAVLRPGQARAHGIDDDQDNRRRPRRPAAWRPTSRAPSSPPLQHQRGPFAVTIEAWRGGACGRTTYTCAREGRRRRARLGAGARAHRLQRQMRDTSPAHRAAVPRDIAADGAGDAQHDERFAGATFTAPGPRHLAGPGEPSIISIGRGRSIIALAVTKASGGRRGRRHHRRRRKMGLARIAETNRAERGIFDDPGVSGRRRVLQSVRCRIRSACLTLLDTQPRDQPSRPPHHSQSSDSASEAPRSKPRTNRHAAVSTATSLPAPMTGGGMAARYETRARSTTSPVGLTSGALGTLRGVGRANHPGRNRGT